MLQRLRRGELFGRGICGLRDLPGGFLNAWRGAERGASRHTALLVSALADAATEQQRRRQRRRRMAAATHALEGLQRRVCDSGPDTVRHIRCVETFVASGGPSAVVRLLFALNNDEEDGESPRSGNNHSHASPAAAAATTATTAGGRSLPGLLATLLPFIAAPLTTQAEVGRDEDEDEGADDGASTSAAALEGGEGHGGRAYAEQTFFIHNQCMALLREAAFCVPGVASALLADVPFLQLLVAQVHSPLSFNTTSSLLEELFASGTGAFNLASLPGFGAAVLRMTPKHLAHFSRVLGQIVYDPDREEVLVGEALIDGSKQPKKARNVDIAHTVIVGIPGLLERLCALLQAQKIAFGSRAHTHPLFLSSLCSFLFYRG